MKKQIILTLLIFLSGTLAAQQVYNLDSCIQIGLQNNLDILIQREYQKISENNATYGNAGGLPTISADASGGMNMKNNYNANEQGITTATVNMPEENLNAGINVSWTIFSGFKISSTYKKLKGLEELEKIYTCMAIENTIAQIMEVYYQIIRQEMRLDNLEASTRLSSERMQIAKQRYELGDFSLIEYQQAEVDFNSDTTLYIKQQRVVYEYYLQLNKLLAFNNVEQPLLITEREINLLQLTDKDSLLHKTLLLNTNLLAAASEIALKEHDLRIVKSQFYPTLRLNGGYNYGGLWNDLPPITNQQRLDLNGSLTLGINIFDGMNRRREKRNAEIAIDISRLEQDLLIQDLKVQFATLWMSYTNNLALVNLEENNIASARALHTSAMERYRLGELSGIELREAQNKLLLSEEKLSASQLDTKLNEIALLLISGTIVKEVIE